MSLVDITPLPAEDEIMDPAIKQYVDSSSAFAEARSDLKLAEFRATMEAYTARADEREAAASKRAEEREAAANRRAEEREAAVREREAAASKRAEEREAAVREREAAASKRAEEREAAISMHAAEREAAAREREATVSKRTEERDAAAREREAAAFKQWEERDTAARRLAEEREAASRERIDHMFKTMDRIEAGIVNLKRTVITTAIAATLSTVFGVAAFNAALMQNIFAAIELGQKTSPPILKMQADIDDIKKQLAESRAARDR